MPIGQFLGRVGRVFAQPVAPTTPRTPSFMPPQDDEEPDYSPEDSDPGAGTPAAPPASDDAGPLDVSPPRSAASAMGAPAPTQPRSPAAAMGQPMPTPPAAPNTPGGQKIGIGRQIGGALIQGAGMMFPPAAAAARIAGEKVGQGSYPAQERQFEKQIALQKTQADLAKEQATAEETKQRGRYFGQQADTLAEEGKKPYITVPGGGLFNTRNGQWVRQPADKSQLTQITKEEAESRGIAPLPDGTYAIPNTALGQYFASQKDKASVHKLDDGTVISYTPGDDQAKVVYKGNPKIETDLTDLQINGKPHKAIVNKQTGELIKDLGESGIKPPVTNINNETRRDRTAGLKAYTPALESAERFNVMTKNYEDAVKNHDQQAMLSLLANHLGMTMGLQKGARLTKDIIHEAEQSRPWLQGLAAKFDKDGYLSGVNLSPEQMRQMVSLGRERFAEDISKGKSEAQYMGIADDGPRRTPNKATMNHYLGLTNGDVTKAKTMAAADGWSVN